MTKNLVYRQECKSVVHLHTSHPNEPTKKNLTLIKPISDNQSSIRTWLYHWFR